MPVVTAYASGSTNETGAATWASQSNAYGSTSATFATWTNSTNGATASIDYNGFGTWSSIPDGSTINNVTVTIKGYVNNTSRILAPTARLYIGSTPKGSGATTLSTHSTTSTNVYGSFQYTDVSLPELEGNTMLVRFNVTHGANTQSGIQYVDYFQIDVDYTAPLPTYAGWGRSM